MVAILRNRIFRKLSIAVIVITSPNIRVQTLCYTSQGNKTGQYTPLCACRDIYFAREVWPAAMLLVMFTFPMPVRTST